ncbi:MAG: ArgR family transcriptional regulator [Acidobacteria bacterium]|nr:ArgR family transcriptional regulator [Acidobacteriota bacterium]
MNKAYRQDLILRLIRKARVRTQEQLLRELKAMGVEATQVTLSRDIRELGLVKTPDGYAQVSRVAPGPSLATIAAEAMTGARTAQNLVVVKTLPGHASSLASAIDHEEWPEVVGTIAGDDTVLVIAPDTPTAVRLHNKFMEYVAV